MDNTFTNNPGNTRNLTGRDVVAGLFHDNASAEQAVRALRDAGFAQDTIGIAVRERDAEGNMVADASGGATAAGLVGGGVLGGLVGYLLGIGALAIPGIGPIVAGGILATTLAGAAIGAGAGGLIGAMTSMGIPEEEASHFNTGFERGDTLVTVRAGKLESVKVVRHREKQFYAALTDTPRKIIAKQSVRGIDATTNATITSEAIINATAKALGERK